MTQSKPLIIATRESRLAMWQAEHVQALLQNLWKRQVELLGMTTKGDQILDRALSKVGGKGLFVKELETALQEKRADLAVHSLKDVPMDMPEGFVLAAVFEREDPRDAWVSNHHARWQDLPQGARVGTSSLRRVVQLRAARPDLQIEPLRGNLDTRLRKLDEGQFDGIVLAAAGLKRLGLSERIRSHWSVDDMIPCAGQGALGIEVRAEDQDLQAAFAAMIHRPTWLAVQAERAVSRVLGGSCSVPLAAHASWLPDQPDHMRLQVALGHVHDATAPLLKQTLIAVITTDEQAMALGQQAAQLLRDQGGQAYLDAI